MRKATTRFSAMAVGGGLLVILVVYLIGFNRNDSLTRTSPSPTISSYVANVPVGAIPTSGGYLWRVASNSNQQTAQCLTKQRIRFGEVRTLNYTNDVAAAQANVSWIQGVNAPPDYLTSALQFCLAGSDQARESIGVNAGNFDASSTTAAEGDIYSYATATSVDGLMVLTFWVQPGASMMSPSPASVMAARAVAQYKLAQEGVSNPEVVACHSVGPLPKAKIPPEVMNLLEAKYEKLAPYKILSQYTVAVDVRAESVTPHICVYSEGQQIAHYGVVPATATQAIEVSTEHAPWPPTFERTSIVVVAKTPTEGWKIVSEGTSP
ncbi:MAG TPA: hypothetical protein VMV52_04375 [Candidatus Nanopelagicaceae bacterium]|nr:hypothetical protein [Candidatus Nanopelagicaceae bacterium]